LSFWWTFCSNFKHSYNNEEIYSLTGHHLHLLVRHKQQQRRPTMQSKSLHSKFSLKLNDSLFKCVFILTTILTAIFTKTKNFMCETCWVCLNTLTYDAWGLKSTAFYNRLLNCRKFIRNHQTHQVTPHLTTRNLAADETAKSTQKIIRQFDSKHCIISWLSLKPVNHVNSVNTLIN
jgi:hypothetical protein